MRQPRQLTNSKIHPLIFWAREEREWKKNHSTGTAQENPLCRAGAAHGQQCFTVTETMGKGI